MLTRLDYKNCMNVCAATMDAKEVRVIYNESQANYMVLKHVFGDIVSLDRDPASDRCIGIASNEGATCAIFTRWFHVFHRHTGAGWPEFLDWLETVHGHESDKKAWKASPGPVDLWAYLIMLLVQVDLDGMSEGAIRRLCRALADYACPAIKVHGSKVFHAPYRIGSGSYLTAHGNTWRHSFMADYVLDRLSEQGLITEEEEEYLRQFDVLGDDFRGLVIHRETAELFDWTIDQVFGTVTTTSTNPHLRQAQRR